MNIEKEYDKAYAELQRKERMRDGYAYEDNGTLVSKLLKPFRAVKQFFLRMKDQLIMIFTPWREKRELIDEAMAEIRQERVQQKKLDRQENLETTEKKMEIIRDETIDTDAKLKDLCLLCRQTGRDLTVVTNMGAFKFEYAGDDVLVKHAYVEYKTKESGPSYNFQICGGISFRENTTEPVFIDMFEPNQFFLKGEQFDAEKKYLGEEAIVETVQRMSDIEQSSEEKKEFTKEQEQRLDGAILHSDNAVVEEMISQFTANQEEIPLENRPDTQEGTVQSIIREMSQEGDLSGFWTEEAETLPETETFEEKLQRLEREKDIEKEGKVQNRETEYEL